MMHMQIYFHDEWQCGAGMQSAKYVYSTGLSVQCVAVCCSVLQCVAGIQSTLFACAMPLAIMRLVHNAFVLLLSDDSHQLSLLHDHLRKKEKERKKRARERERARSKETRSAHARA